jgi:hypothetical protein
MKPLTDMEILSIYYIQVARNNKERNLYRRLLIQNQREIEIARQYGIKERGLNILNRCLIPITLFETLATPLLILYSYAIQLYFRKRIFEVICANEKVPSLDNTV